MASRLEPANVAELREKPKAAANGEAQAIIPFARPIRSHEWRLDHFAARPKVAEA